MSFLSSIAMSVPPYWLRLKQEAQRHARQKKIYLTDSFKPVTAYSDCRLKVKNTNSRHESDHDIWTERKNR